MAQISETVDYTKKAFLHSSYRWVKLTPVGSTGQTATLSNTSSTIVNFEIPNNVMNLAQSKLTFDMLFPTTGDNTLVSNIDALGLSMFDRITLSTRSGVVLANCDNMGQFAHLISKIKNKALSLVDNPSTATATPVSGMGVTTTDVPTGTVLTNGLNTYPLPNVLNSSTLLSNKKPFTDICKSGACPPNISYRTAYTCSSSAGAVVGGLNFGLTQNNVSSLYRLDGSFISTPFIENLHIITENKVGTSGARAVAGPLATSYHLPLGTIKDTLLEINKSIYFGDNLILSLSFNPTSKFSWLSTTGVDGRPTLSTAVYGAVTSAVSPQIPVQWTPNAGATATTLTATVSGLSLYVAVETDPVISSQLINRVNNEGFSMTVPFVYCTKTPCPVSAATITSVGTGSFAMQQRITRGYGQRLLRCYSAIFGPEGTGNQCIVDNTTALPRTIGDGVTVKGTANAVVGFTTNQHDDHPLGGYNTSLDGVRLQDFTLSAEDSTHWLVNEPYLRGSCILNVEQYKNQCLHIDSWTGRPVCEEDDTVDNGLSLDADKTYGVSYTSLYNISNSTSSKQHYLFFVVQRQLTIKGSQIGLM